MTLATDSGTNPTFAEVATFTFTVTSTYHRAVTGRFLYLIFRDQSGQVIGGAGGGGDVGRPCDSVSPGPSRCTTEVLSPLPPGLCNRGTLFNKKGQQGAPAYIFVSGRG